MNAKLRRRSTLVRRAVSRWRQTRDPTARFLLGGRPRAVIG